MPVRTQPPQPIVQVRSDRGVRRKTNQDVALARMMPAGWLLLAVADGVGGHRAGDVASATAMAVLEAELRRSPDPVARLAAAVSAANTRVHAKAAERAEWAGMASTLVAAVTRNGEAWIANVGDSRAYLVVNGKAAQLTEDHTLLAERQRAGGPELDANLARLASHTITRSIGHEPLIEVDLVGPVAVDGGATILLCSDGLHGQVSDAEIASTVADGGEIVGSLIALANAAGGRDNVSVALATIR